MNMKKKIRVSLAGTAVLLSVLFVSQAKDANADYGINNCTTQRIGYCVNWDVYRGCTLWEICTVVIYSNMYCVAGVYRCGFSF